MPICHRSRRRLSLWGSLDLFGSSNAVPLACSEQDGLNHPDAGRVVEAHPCTRLVGRIRSV